MADEGNGILRGFKLLDLEDRAALNRFLRADPPEVSELSFTNLFMWRHHHRPCWREYAGCLVMAWHPPGGEAFGMMPVGPGDRRAALDFLLGELAVAGHQPSVRRASRRFVEAGCDPARHLWRPERDQFDYVYLASDLVSLAGRKLHAKKNHLNKFQKSFSHEYRPLDAGLVDGVLGMQEAWCELRDCTADPTLLDEDHAIYEALRHFGQLDYIGGAILVGGRVEAFALGERLNPSTAVIHIEKANPDLGGLYAAINQGFAAAAFGGMEFINREQDLGLEGLRRAKESYQPHHLVEKFIITPR